MTAFAILCLGVIGQVQVPDGFASEAQPWELVDNDDDIQIWSRPNRQSSIDEVLARAQVDVPVGRLWDVLEDVEHYHEFMPHMSNARILERAGPGIIYQYQKVDAPMVSTRDCVMRIELEVDRDKGRFRRAYRVSHPPLAPPVEDGVIRMRKAQGVWEIRRITDDTSELIYQALAEPGGRIPSWITNYANSSVVSDVLSAVRARARNPGYRPD